jgi:hypothetical protein
MNRTVKLKGTHLFSKERWTTIRNVVLKTNSITIKASMLAKAYYLSQQEAIPLDKEFYDLCIKVVTNTSLNFRGDVTEEKQSKQIMYDTMKQLFEQNFGSYIDLKGLSISQILGSSCKLLETVSLNNIQFHYIKYLNLYMYKYLEGTAKSIIARARNHILYDTTEDPYPCPDELIDWVEEHKDFLLPEKNTYFAKDIILRPWIYLRYMVKINAHMETHFPEIKLLSPIVMRRSYIPKHIHLDTNALVQLLMKTDDVQDFVKWYDLKYNEKPNIKNKGDLGNSFKKIFGRKPNSPKEDFMYQQSFWMYLAKFDNPKYKQAISGELAFGNSISTDGCSVSLLLASKQEKKSFKPRKVKKKRTNKEKDMDDFGHEVQPDTLFLGCDPGKGDLVAMTDGIHTFKYTKGQRATDTKRKKYERRSQNVRATLIIPGEFQSQKATLHDYYPMIRDPTLLQYEERILSNSSSKSCRLNEFLKYVKAKLFMEEDVTKLYATPRFRNDRYTRHTLVQSSEDNMLNRLSKFVNTRDDKKKYSTHDAIVEQNMNLKNPKHVNIFYGDWGRNPNLKNQAPTPGIGLRRKIDKRFNTITVSEHYTSKTCPCCKERTLENPILEGPTRSAKKKHCLLSCTNCNRWWNRNWAGSYNILLKGLLQIQEAPA